MANNYKTGLEALRDSLKAATEGADALIPLLQEDNKAPADKKMPAQDRKNAEHKLGEYAVIIQNNPDKIAALELPPSNDRALRKMAFDAGIISLRIDGGANAVSVKADIDKLIAERDAFYKSPTNFENLTPGQQSAYHQLYSNIEKIKSGGVLSPEETQAVGDYISIELATAATKLSTEVSKHNKGTAKDQKDANGYSFEWTQIDPSYIPGLEAIKYRQSAMFDDLALLNPAQKAANDEIFSMHNRLLMWATSQSGSGAVTKENLEQFTHALRDNANIKQLAWSIDGLNNAVPGSQKWTGETKKELERLEEIQKSLAEANPKYTDEQKAALVKTAGALTKLRESLAADANVPEPPLGKDSLYQAIGTLMVPAFAPAAPTGGANPPGTGGPAPAGGGAGGVTQPPKQPETPQQKAEREAAEREAEVKKLEQQKIENAQKARMDRLRQEAEAARGPGRATTDILSGGFNTAGQAIQSGVKMAAVDGDDPLTRTVNGAIDGAMGLGGNFTGWAGDGLKSMFNSKSPWLGIGGGLAAGALASWLANSFLVQNTFLGKIPFAGTIISIAALAGGFLLGRKGVHNWMGQSDTGGVHVAKSIVEQNRERAAPQVDGVGKKEAEKEETLEERRKRVNEKIRESDKIPDPPLPSEGQENVAALRVSIQPQAGGLPTENVVAFRNNGKEPGEAEQKTAHLVNIGSGTFVPGYIVEMPTRIERVAHVGSMDTKGGVEEARVINIAAGRNWRGTVEENRHVAVPYARLEIPA